MDLDFLTSLLDEVALEGLDGITLPMLWIRLQNRSSFSIAIDGESKEFLWECIAVHRDIEIYELPTPRILTPIYNRYDHVDDELGIVLESTEKIFDPYPIASVKDGDVRGSCSTYHTRICVTSEIRTNGALLLSLAEVNERWGEKLVLVASPRLRLHSLTGANTNPLLELNQEEYCLLERIGRSRYLGEVTQGEGGLNKLNAPFTKQVHYYRKHLSSKGLVTKQLHYMKNVKGAIIVGSLFHLTRFHVPHKSRIEHLMKCVCDFLKEKPHHREQSKVVKEQLNIKDTTFRKLMKSPYGNCVKVFYLPYKEILSDSKEKNTSIPLGKMVQVVQLLTHIDEMNETDCHENIKEKNQNFPLNVHFDFSKLYFEIPLIFQVHEIIKNAGSKGINSIFIGQLLTLPKLDIRSLIDTLIKKELIVSILQEKGRTKEVIYIDKKLATSMEENFDLKVGEVDFNQKETLYVKKRYHQKYNLVRVSPADISDHKVKRLKLNDTVSGSIIQGIDHKSEYNTDKNIEKISPKSEAEVCGKAPRLVSLTEKIAPSQVPYCQMTDRKRKRLKMLLDYLKSVGSTTLLEIHKFLTDTEKKENYNFALDRKSTSRFIHVLFLTKELKIFTAVLESNEKKVEVELICDKSVGLDDPCISTSVQQAKFSYFSANSKTDKNENPVTNIFENTVKSCENNELERKSCEPLSRENLSLKTNSKCTRCKTLHEFLFYLVYDYEGHVGDHSKTPVVYHDSMTWKRYVPPLPPAKREGWCFLADVYNRMPLSVFVKVFNMRDKIHYISEYLNDDDKFHYLLSDLPQGFLKTLLDQRSFLFKVDDVLKYLCYMGLISFGPQTRKLKQENFLYIHKKAIIKDTTISTPGFLFINDKMSYEKKIYTLNAISDVEKFWSDLQDICLNTPLGNRFKSSESISSVDTKHKPKLQEVLKFHNFDEIVDLDSIPGDGLGAGGFDSSMFLHYTRNWPIHPVINLKSKAVLKNPVYMQSLLKHKEITSQVSPGRLQRLNSFSPKGNSKVNAPNNGSIFLDSLTKKSKKKGKVKFKTYKQKQKKSATSQKISGKRRKWHAKEDSFLLLCKVASLFLDPTAKPLVVPYVVVKDLLLEKFPVLSAGKTADCCRRRIRIVMLNPTTAYNVSVFLEEAKQDEKLVRQFDQFKPVKTDAAKDIFSHVLKLLTEKISKPVSERPKKTTLPPTADLFHKVYKVLTPCNLLRQKNRHQNPSSEDEISYCTLYSLILSAFAIKQGEVEWSDLLAKLYQKYPEQTFKAVLNHLYDEKIISYKKQVKEKNSHTAFRSTIPFHFSITYHNSLLTKFPVIFFKESKELIENLECLDPKNRLELNDDSPDGYAVAVLTLNFLDILQLSFQIPEQIIYCDFLEAEAQSNVFECISNLSEEESVEFFNLIHGEKKSSQDDRQVKGEPHDTISNIQRSKNATRIALFLLRHNLSQPTAKNLKSAYDFIALNTCKIFCYPNVCFGDMISFRENSQGHDVPVNSRENSQEHNIPVNSRENSQHDMPVNSRKNSQEHNIPVNSFISKDSILTEKCITDIKQMLTSYIPAKAFSQMNVLESLYKMYVNIYSSQTLNDAKNILGEIKKAGSLGIEENKLWRNFEHLSGEMTLFEHLELLQKNMFVIRAGVKSFVYVFMCYAKNWFLPSNTIPCEKKEVRSKVNITNGLNHGSSRKRVNGLGCSNLSQSCDNKHFYEKRLDFAEQMFFLPRTWRYPDGSLNILTFIELLQAVLSYVITSPGVNVSHVTEQFSVALQPVQTLELLEILERAYCIVKYHSKKLPKSTLFSKPSKIYLTECPVYDDLGHIEPLPGAAYNLALLQKAMMKV